MVGVLLVLGLEGQKIWSYICSLILVRVCVDFKMDGLMSVILRDFPCWILMCAGNVTNYLSHGTLDDVS